MRLYFVEYWIAEDGPDGPDGQTFVDVVRASSADQASEIIMAFLKGEMGRAGEFEIEFRIMLLTEGRNGIFDKASDDRVHEFSKYLTSVGHVAERYDPSRRSQR